MGWTEATRRQYCRAGQRVANALTDEEWAAIEPFMPVAKATGRPRTTELRAVVDALLYIAWTGRRGGHCRTASHLFRRFNAISMPGETMGCGRASTSIWWPQHVWRLGARRAIIDSQPAKTTDVAGLRGYDAGKKIKGRKRNIITDTEGRLVGLTVHAADIQDRDGAVRVIASIRQLYPWLRHLFADGGYAGEKLTQALADLGTWTVEIMKRSDTANGFEVLPRRWVVERTFAWLGRYRRLAKDFEATISSAEAWIFIASIRFMLRRSKAPPRA